MSIQSSLPLHAESEFCTYDSQTVCLHCLVTLTNKQSRKAQCEKYVRERIVPNWIKKTSKLWRSIAWQR